MDKKIKTAVIGLDTSHSVEFPRYCMDPAVDAKWKSEDLVMTSCLRFETPFQGKAGLDARQKTLEGLGIKITENFEEAVADCDAVLIEINDPSLHLEYFTKCAALGKKIFLDKPFADSLENALKIHAIAKEKNISYFTSSSLRYIPELDDALEGVTSPVNDACIWGPLGKTPDGSSGIIWYGVHTFEMLQRVMGNGAIAVAAVPDAKGFVCIVTYKDGRRGIVELSLGDYSYGGTFRGKEFKKEFSYTGRAPLYSPLIKEIGKFFKGGSQGVAIRDSLEVMALLDAADRSGRMGGTPVAIVIPE